MSLLESITGLAIIIIFPLLLVLENRYSLRQRTSPLAHRLVINLVVSAFALVAGLFVVKSVTLRLALWTGQQPFGLLNLIDLPIYVKFAVGFLLMDLTFYYWHQANHYVPILWRFHCVHHIDPDLDVSTSFRFHFGEVLYSVAFRVLQVSLIGVSPTIYAVYELAFQCATMFHHSNLCLPIEVERLINKFIVTPRMHGIHHSIVKDETNSNFSVIFRWWDALHGTLRLNVRQSDIIIGVPAYHKPHDNWIWNVLALPFREQREYWSSPGTQGVKRETISESGIANVLLP